MRGMCEGLGYVRGVTGSFNPFYVSLAIKLIKIPRAELLMVNKDQVRQPGVEFLNGFIKTVQSGLRGGGPPLEISKTYYIISR